MRVDRIILLTRTKADLAKKLKVSEWTLHSYLKKGLTPKPFPLVAVGELRWRTSDIADWLDELQRHPRKARLRAAVAKLANRSEPLRREEMLA